MGRKNKNVRQANDRDRRARKLHEQVPSRRPPTPLEALILPDGQCTFGRMNRRPKARFATLEKAEKALAQAQHQRSRTGSAHVEKRVYACPPGGCGGYHLSSRESWRD